jgi:hypothetical protein
MKFKKNDTYRNPATGNKLARSTGKRYESFYKKNPKNTPLVVARGGKNKLKETVKRAEQRNKRVVRLSPAGPVYVRLINGKLAYRKVTKTKPIVVKEPKRKPTIPKKPEVIVPRLPEEPITTKTPEENLAEFGFAVERYLRQYAIIDLRNNPDKFGDDHSIEYKELYSSQQELYNALKAAQKSDSVGLKIGGTDAPNLDQTNAIAEFLDIPKWKTQKVYFSDANKKRILEKLKPITKREVKGYNPLSHVKKKRRYHK